MRAADLIGQLGDPITEEGQCAVQEFGEIGLNRQLGYETPADLVDKYPQFYWGRVSPYIQDTIRYLNVTSGGSGSAVSTATSFAPSTSSCAFRARSRDQNHLVALRLSGCISGPRGAHEQAVAHRRKLSPRSHKSPRRNRKAEGARQLVAEHVLTASDLIWPLFLIQGEKRRVPVAAMPGVDRLSVDEALREAGRAVELEIPAIAFFPYTEPELKDAQGSEAFNDGNLVCRACRAIKSKFPSLGLSPTSPSTRIRPRPRRAGARERRGT